MPSGVEVNWDRRRVASRRLDRICYPDLNPADLSVCGSEVCQVRGYSRRAELWSCSVSGAWLKKCVWMLPGIIPVPRSGLPRPAFGTAQWCSRRRRGIWCPGACAVRVLGYSPVETPSWQDPHYRVYSNGDPAPVIDPSGKTVIFRPSTDGGGELRVAIVSLGGGAPKGIVVWKPGDPPEAPIPDLQPATVSHFHWIPNSSIVAIEVIPAESAQSYIFLLDARTRASTCLPFVVERDQWCVVPCSGSGVRSGK